MAAPRIETQPKKITRVSVEEQKHLEGTQIPVVERNYYTGWPLLQISLFIPGVPREDKNTCANMLAGGNCHLIFVAAFFFAKLLTQVEGRVEIKSAFSVTRDQFNVANISSFLDSYTVTHKKLNISIAQTVGGFGKSLAITLSEGDGEKLANSLQFLQYGVLKKGKKLPLMDGWSEVAPILEEDVREALIPGYAIFENGQIYVDLGVFLEREVGDSDLVDFLKGAFRVSQFKEQYDCDQEASSRPLVWQLIGIATVAQSSTKATSKQEELEKMIQALSSVPSGRPVTKGMLREAFKNILLISLQPRQWLLNSTTSGKKLRDELRRDQYADLRELLNIVISDEPSGLRYRDLRGYLTGKVGAEAAKRDSFFSQRRSVAVIEDPFKYDSNIKSIGIKIHKTK